MNNDWYLRVVEDIARDKTSRSYKTLMNLIKYEHWEEVRNYKFRQCEFSKKTLLPFTKVYVGTYTNNAGALFGGPPAIKKVYADKNTLIYKKIKGELD